MEIDQTRLLTLATAAAIDSQGARSARALIAEIKVAAPRVALAVIDRAMQILGGKGVGPDTYLPHYFAIARMLRLADGPDEVHMYQLGKSCIKKYGNQ
jgi:acyl-CoA dehydrogenase